MTASRGAGPRPPTAGLNLSTARAAPPGASPADADVIVIGAGIVGAACAWRLAERGLRVQVVERAPAPATGSTGRSAAGVRHQFSDETNVRLSLASIAEYRAMPESGYRPAGYLFLVPEAQWDAHARAAELQRALGIPVQTLSPGEAARRVPLESAGLGGATFCALDGVVDPHGICLAYVARARALQASFAFSCEVIGIARDGRRWLVDGSAGRFRAPVLVNAAGAWSGAVAALAGLDLPVLPARRMVWTTAPLPGGVGPALPCPLTVDLASGVWFRSEGTRLIFGLANPADSGFREGIDWDWLEPTWIAAAERFDWFEALAVDRRACWWGYYELTPDHNPVLGRRPDAEGWIDACGFSGHGVQHAAAVGRLVAQEAAGETPFIDLRPFAIGRFSDPGRTGGGERLAV